VKFDRDIFIGFLVLGIGLAVLLHTVIPFLACLGLGIIVSALTGARKVVREEMKKILVLGYVLTGFTLIILAIGLMYEVRYIAEVCSFGFITGGLMMLGSKIGSTSAKLEVMKYV